MINWEVVAACQACLLLLLAWIAWVQRRRLRRQAADHVICQSSANALLGRHEAAREGLTEALINVGQYRRAEVDGRTLFELVELCDESFRHAATTIRDSARRIDAFRDENETLREQRANIASVARTLINGDHPDDPIRVGRLLDGLRGIAATLANHERTTP